MCGCNCYACFLPDDGGFVDGIPRELDELLCPLKRYLSDRDGRAKDAEEIHKDFMGNGCEMPLPCLKQHLSDYEDGTFCGSLCPLRCEILGAMGDGFTDLDELERELGKRGFDTTETCLIHHVEGMRSGGLIAETDRVIATP